MLCEPRRSHPRQPPSCLHTRSEARLLGSTIRENGRRLDMVVGCGASLNHTIHVVMAGSGSSNLEHFILTSFRLKAMLSLRCDEQSRALLIATHTIALHQSFTRREKLQSAFCQHCKRHPGGILSTRRLLVTLVPEAPGPGMASSASQRQG